MAEPAQGGGGGGGGPETRNALFAAINKGADITSGKRPAAFWENWESILGERRERKCVCICSGT